MSTDMATFNWDSITMRVGVTADPAAGAQIAAITVPTGKRWVIYSLEATLVCDATVANRFFNIYLRMNGTDTTYITPTGLTITASQTKLQSYIANSLVTAAGTQYGMHIPLVELPAGAVVLLYLNAGVAGDNTGPCTYTYKEAPA